MRNISPIKFIILMIFLMFILPSVVSGPSFLKLLAIGVFVILIINLFKSFKNMHQNPVDLGGVSEFFRKLGKISGITILFIIVIVVLLISIRVIPAGTTGVYHLFGKVADKELSSGIHLIIPLAHIEKMSIRTEEYTMSIVSTEGKRKGSDVISALTKEGLMVDLDMTVLYHLEEDNASDIYKNVGLNYEEKIIRPEIRSSIREVVARYEAKDIYSEKRQEAAQSILDYLQGKMEGRGIVIESVLLRNVNLPEKLNQAIQEKLQAEQEAEKYDFILAKEKKEAERKREEAAGQRDAQKIINQSLTPNYLNYLYIKELKDREGTIYVPVSPDTGMPMFKGVR